MSRTTSASTLISSNLTLEVDSGDELHVRDFSVIERISSLFTANIVAVSYNPAIDFDAVVGRPARFTLRAATQERSWAGVCNHFQQIGVEEDGLSTYELSLVPVLWLATQRSSYRIFQHLSEPDIVLKLLDEWGIQPELRLAGSYKKRKYRVQYAESDYSFICRMLEDAGISFYFVHNDGETELVLCDAPHLNEPRRPQISFKDDISLENGEYVTRVRIGQQVRPGRYTMRDHDYRRAPTNQPTATAQVLGRDLEQRLERYHYTPGAFLFGTDRGEASPVADGGGKTRVDEAEAALLAQKRLEAKRASAKVCTFDTNAVDLAPGVVMSIDDHPRPDLGRDRRLLVIEAAHSGSSTGSWSHHCEVRSAEQPFRPPLVTAKPRVIGVESATVVGPAGEEIHTDEFGRIKVHFHWDRESQMDDSSSCWIHVSQPWGGAGYGGINLPRVGQEVLVEFLGGDPDRPIVVGRVYTGVQKVPYSLPANKTQSGWRSASYPGGGGYNEIMFEDKKGAELLNIQAERDLHKLVKNDEEVTVGHDRTTLVQNDEDLTIGNNRSKLVQMNEREVVGMSRTRMVGINESVDIGMNQSLSVGAMQSVLVGAAQTVNVGTMQTVAVGAAQSTTIGAAQSISVGASQSVKVGGAQNVKVGLASTETVGLVKALTVGAAYQITVGGAMNTTVAMTQSEQVGLTKTVNVGKKLEIICGAAKLVLEASGKVAIVGTEFSFESSGSVLLKGGTVQVVGDPINLN